MPCDFIIICGPKKKPKQPNKQKTKQKQAWLPEGRELRGWEEKVKGLRDSQVLKDSREPWLVWLSGLSAGLLTKGSLVQFPVRAHAWVVGQVSNRGPMRGITH